MIRRTSRVIAAVAVATLVVAACGGDDDESTDTDAPGSTEAPDATAAPDTEAPDVTEDPDSTEVSDTEAPEVTETTAESDGGEGWTVSTDDCIDPDRANEPIEGSISIGSAMPLSGGAAAAAFAPVAAGLQAYIDYANANELVPGYEITIEIGDDQYDPGLTPGVVTGLLDSGVHLFSGIIGTPNNLGVRDTLNEECVPQLLALTGSPAWGEVADYPWTTGALIPYDIESAAYAADFATEFPDGPTVGLFYVNNDFGQIYKDAFLELADSEGFEVVDEQTIEAAETAPPAAQVASIAGNAPDVIMAIPLGAQCATFASELANAKAANPGWEPRLYVTNTCASQLILAISGAAADGLYTSASAGIRDILNPENASVPGVAAYLAEMESQGQSDSVPTSSAGWTVGELTVEILRQAAESPDGLTQASIMNASRNLDFVPSLVREGVTYKMSGEEDAYYAEDIQVVQWDVESGLFNDVGELNTSFRSS